MEEEETEIEENMRRYARLKRRVHIQTLKEWARCLQIHKEKKFRQFVSAKVYHCYRKKKKRIFYASFFQLSPRNLTRKTEVVYEFI